jgi:hypothetical protein
MWLKHWDDDVAAAAADDNEDYNEYDGDETCLVR